MADIHMTGFVPNNTELSMIRDKLYAYIFPNTPQTPEQVEAFEKAVQYQLEHEKTIQAQSGENGLPNGIKSFSIGDFSMSFEDGATSNALTKKTICPYAHGVLLREGLLYKGVERSY